MNIPNIPVRVKPEPIDNTALVEAHRANGGGILHLAPPVGERGLTIAFKQQGSRITIATGCQHRNDAFTRKVGTKTAVTHFNNGSTITIPVPTDYRNRPVKLLRRLFYAIV